MNTSLEIRSATHEHEAGNIENDKPVVKPRKSDSSLSTRNDCISIHKEDTREADKLNLVESSGGTRL